MPFPFRCASLVLVFAVLGLAGGAQEPSGGAAGRSLEERLSGRLTPDRFSEANGFLLPVLEALDLPASSQTLVYSRTSLNRVLVGPDNPRAVYFNDDTYVAFVPGATQLEIARVDPKNGLEFVTVDQEPSAPVVTRDDVCALCHRLGKDRRMRLIMRSAFVDRDGHDLQHPEHMNELQFLTTDRSPFTERWGGWYVTGTHGSRQPHMGNLASPQALSAIGDVVRYAKGLNLSHGANVVDLGPRIRTASYPTPGSDLVALCVLGHQVSVENLMSPARFIQLDGLTGEEGQRRLTEVAEPLARALLFWGEYQFTEPVAGTSTFRTDFERRGPFDRAGRSLRQLDLQHRLMRYPLSFMIYSPSFTALPAAVRSYVYRRIQEVLSGRLQAPDLKWSADDRTAVREILQDTLPAALAQP